MTTAPCITLKGSAQTVVEYLYYAINSILYQRGVYPQEEFDTKENYGVMVMMTKDEKIKDFLRTILRRTEAWLRDGKIERLTMVLFDVRTKKAIERWDFRVDDDTTYDPDFYTEEMSKKTLDKVQAEIRSVMRQITSTVSFLPVLENPVTFDVLIEAKPSEWGKEVPEWTWNSTRHIDITDAQLVQLRTFSTGVSKIGSAVVYKTSNNIS